jgi:hypothetical protein
MARASVRGKGGKTGDGGCAGVASENAYKVFVVPDSGAMPGFHSGTQSSDPMKPSSSAAASRGRVWWCRPSSNCQPGRRRGRAPGMKPISLVVVISLLLLTACGGDGTQRPAEQTGTLHGGEIQGVEWRTPSRSGTTDASGRFNYLPGEAVTFSIGTVELGTAPGASDISLFTLAGVTPPTTERALRRQLDLAMSRSTPFTRAMNLDLLLIALDADGNPVNGLDVRNRASTLTGKSLDFDQTIGTFQASLYATVPSLVQRIAPYVPVVHLYASLGLHVPVHARTRVESQGSFALFPTIQTFGYRADGSLESDAADWNADGSFESRTRYEYDPLGRLTHEEYAQDGDFDGVVDRSFSLSQQFDARGKLVQMTQSSVAPGIRQTWRLVEYSIDDLGRPTREVSELDRNDDGVVDERQVASYQYDSHSVATVTTTHDAGADGSVDTIARTTERYDAHRRLVSRVYENDALADGIVDSRSTELGTYDDVARTMRLVSETDSDADGIVDSRVLYDWRFDRDGNPVASTFASEPLADGQASQVQIVARDFDRDGRVTRSSSRSEYHGMGLVDTQSIATFVYDDVGNIAERTSAQDSGADGTFDFHSREGYEYGAGGELLASAAHFDWNGDGVSDTHSATTVTNAVLDDGVLQLAQWYFSTRYPGSPVYVGGVVAQFLPD